ncbi:MAG: 5-oxoprolinase subunit PxpB [Candidatus Thioglobus sp.]|nr:5-oxoprolinase subunit PxpB [Candidatus Thioglobus sp.]
MLKIILAGEDSILIYFGDKIKPELVMKISAAAEQLSQELSDFIIDLTPSYTSLLLRYDLGKIDYQSLYDKVENCLKNPSAGKIKTGKLIEIPVHYGADFGLDLQQLLTQKNLKLEDFIQIHAAEEYLVYAIGFSPAFAFLGEVDKSIQAPRLATPRISIPAGSVGIAENQTGVYPNKSSGGWNIIGRTPLDLSLKNPANIDKFSIGDKVKFRPISRREFDEF